MTLHVALIRHIKKCKTRVILVLGTDPTVKRAAFKHYGVGMFWQVWWLKVVITSFIILIVCRDETHRLTTLGTELTQVDCIVFSDHMGVN